LISKGRHIYFTPVEYRIEKYLNSRGTLVTGVYLIYFFISFVFFSVVDSSQEEFYLGILVPLNKKPSSWHPGFFKQTDHPSWCAKQKV